MVLHLNRGKQVEKRRAICIEALRNDFSFLFFFC